MREVYIAAVDMIRFGRYIDSSIKELSARTVAACLKEAGLEKSDIQALWFSNSGWGETGQICIRGQVALRPMGIGGIPITNVENACAGGSTALHHAWMGVASGLYDITMAVGAEKLYSRNKMAVFMGFLGGIDIENVIPIIEKLMDFKLTEDDYRQIEEFRKKHPTAGLRPAGRRSRESRHSRDCATPLPWRSCSVKRSGMRTCSSWAGSRGATTRPSWTSTGMRRESI